MKIRIIGWKYENIRKMGNTEINLQTDDGNTYPVSLIMMPNGTGKTTTVKLLRGVLSGKAADWNEKTVKSFAPFRGSADKGKFQLKISFDSIIYYYILILDYIEGKTSIRTSIPAEIGGMEEGWQPPYELKGIMDNEEFVNRFIFDGEQAKKTLDAGNEEAEKAIINLYQINKLDLMIEEIRSLVEIKQENSSGKNTWKGTRILQGKEKAREERYKKLCKREKETAKEIRRKKEEKEKYFNEYQEIISQDERFLERNAKLTEELSNVQIEMGRTIRNTMSAMQKVYDLHPAFDKKLKDLADNMQALKLPKSTAREFFNELANDDYCICGCPIGEKERNTILLNANKYLGQEELVALNAIKSSLREYKVTDNLKNNIKELEECIEKTQELTQDKRSLEEEIADSNGENAIKVKEKIGLLEKEIEELEKEQNILNTKELSYITGLDKDNNIYLAKKAWEECREQYLRACGMVEFTQRAETMKGYLREIKDQALIKLKENVLEETNKKIANIIKNDNIVVEKIERHLILKGREAVSEGQTLAIAYAYIGSLFEHAFFEFPFVVDSPAAAMDLDVRREVAGVVQKLFDQLVIFVTSGEVKGFAETFYKRDGVQYLTIKGGKEEDVECISGKEFFNSYQAEEEGDL